MKDLHVAPICCGRSATWTDLGPKLMYYFCKSCKNEVYSSAYHFLGTDKCYELKLCSKPTPCYGSSIDVHFWPDNVLYKKKEPCNCKKSRP